jgi:hypothetical protein
VIELNTSDVITLLVAFLGMLGTFGWLLLKLFTRQIEKQFKAIERANEASTRHWDQRFGDLNEAVLENEREILRLRAELPGRFVAREDWIRFSGTIDYKLDALYEKLDTLRG